VFKPLSVFVAISVLLGCQPEEEPVPALPQVFVATAEQVSYNPVVEFNGRLQSRDEVQVSSLVSGALVSIYFEEGQTVSEGDELFEVDPEPYQAQVEAATADVARARTTYENDLKTLNRAQQLIGDGYISQSEFDGLEATAASSGAQLQAAQAALHQAEINLQHTRITAVAGGRMSRSNYNIGEIVGPESGALATLVGGQVMDVLFQINETDFFKAVRRGGSDIPLQRVADVELVFSDGEVYPHKGYLDYIGNRVNEQTASIEVRGVVPNPTSLLRPGQYVIARLTIQIPRTVLVIPQSAVQVDQRGTYAMVVDDQGTVSRVNLDLGDRIEANVIVNAGLSAGDDVIVSGVQRVRSGQQAEKRPISSEAENQDS